MNYIRANNNSQFLTPPSGGGGLKKREWNLPLSFFKIQCFTIALFFTTTGFATTLLATFTFALTILSLIVGCGTGMVGTIGGKSSRFAIIKHFLILINIHTKI